MRIVFLFCLFIIHNSIAQSDKFERYKYVEQQYFYSHISKKEFLHKADSLLEINFDKKGTTTTDSLVLVLQMFREAAWSEKKFSKFRTQYYKYLTINSQLSGRGGEAFFYSGKYGEELKKNRRKDAFEIVTKLHYLTRNENFEDVIKTYLENKLYLQSIWVKSSTAEFTDEDSDQAFKILTNLSNVYINLLKFEKAKGIQEYAKKLHCDILSNPYLSEKAKVKTDLAFNYLNFYINLYEGNIDSAQSILNTSTEIVTQSESILGSNALYHIDRINTHKQQLYFVLNDPNNILKTINEKKTDRYRGHYENMIEAEVRGRVAAMQNNFKNAYDYLFEALSLQKQEYKIISKEMNELLYSHAEAEYNRLEVLKAEKHWKRVLLWITIFGLISLLVIILLVYLLNIEKYRLKDLNRITQIQINEAIQRTSLEEKRKFGQDLHDGMSGTFALLLYNITDIKNLSTEQNIKVELDSLYSRFHTLYADIRTTSHNNFNAPLEVKNDFLEESIKKISNSALKNTITKDVSVDKHVSILFDTATRIEILRILQEALTNIVKHAKKVTQVFIYLYKNQNSIILEVGNNGTTNRLMQSEGIGIQSIRSRVKSLGGSVNIIKSGSEFILEIELPINL